MGSSRLQLLSCLLTLLIISCGADEDNTSSGGDDNSNVRIGKTRSSDFVYRYSQPSKPSGEYGIVNDNEDEVATRFISVKQFLKGELCKEQLFSIRPDRDTVITGAGGTEIFFPANSLAGANGKLATSILTVKLKEYYSFSDMYIEGLTTVSGNKILESGGMVHLEAWCGEEKLQLKPYSELEMSVPGNLEKDMKVFYGEQRGDELINWKVDKYSAVPYPVVVCIKSKVAEQVVDFFAENYKFEKKDMLELRDATWSYNVSFNDKGKIIGYTNVYNDPGTAIYKASEKFFEIIPGLSKSVKGIRFPNWQIAFVFAMKSPEDFLNIKLKRKVREKLSRPQISNARQRFFIGTLGWLNIDCYLFPEKRIPTTNIMVYSDNDYEDVKLAFKNKKSLISGIKGNGVLLFADIPLNEEITLVGSYCTGGAIYLAVTDVVVKESLAVVRLEYTTCTGLDDFQERLDGI